MKIKKLELKELRRELEGKRNKKSFDSKDHMVIDEDRRVLEFSLSSEEPYLRWFGYETLLHGPENIAMDRFNNKPAFLDGHDWDKQIGVIEKAWIEDSRLKIHVRFSKNPHASEVYRDILDGIRTKVSIGYEIKDLILNREDEHESYYDITRWEPYEGSSVSIPADDTVGYGRDREEDLIEKANEVVKEKIVEQEKVIENKPIIEVKEMKKEVDVGAEIETAKNSERKRIAEILEVGAQFHSEDMARSFIGEGKTVDQLRRAILENYNNSPQSFAKNQGGEDMNINLDKKETKTYSLLKAINACHHQDWSMAGFEKEVSDDIAKRMGSPSQGFYLPKMARTGQTVGTDADGGYLVDTELKQDDYIDLLVNNPLVVSLGATQLRDLVGDVQIPRQITDVTVEAVAENSAATESKFTLDQVSLNPKEFTAFDSFSRKLFIQTSGDIENYILRSLRGAMDRKIDFQALSGSGSGNEATGIRNTTGIGDVDTGTNGGAPDWAKMVAMETQVAIDNALLGDLNYLVNSSVNGSLKTIEKASSTAQFLKMNNEVNGYNCAVSNQLPSDISKGTGTNLSTSIFGNWADLLIGYWGATDIIVDPFTSSTTGKVRITIAQLADVAVRHPQSFCEMSGIITT
ncbi:MAG: phage major capsid protein [Planctomycetota bacterium]|nr:MAG: phage major capsid protein [Planctomycetota bacterium]